MREQHGLTWLPMVVGMPNHLPSALARYSATGLIGPAFAIKFLITSSSGSSTRRWSEAGVAGRCLSVASCPPWSIPLVGRFLPAWSITLWLPAGLAARALARDRNRRFHADWEIH